MDTDRQEHQRALPRSRHAQDKKAQESAAARAFYAQQLMQPEWLTDIPGALASSWCLQLLHAVHASDSLSSLTGPICPCRLVMARPEGQRCLVVASHQRTVSRTRAGTVLHTFESALPGGSPATCTAADTYSILDCVFHAPDRTLYVLDLMCWAGYLLYDCGAEFRMFWAQSKLAELDAAASPAATTDHSLRFRPVSAHPCTQGQLSRPAPAGGRLGSMRSPTDWHLCTVQMACLPHTAAHCPLSGMACCC